MTEMIKKEETIPMGTEEGAEYGKFLKTGKKSPMDQELLLLRQNFLH